MHLNDLLITLMGGVAVFGGVAFGVMAGRKGFLVCRRAIVAALVLMSADMLAVAVVAGLGAVEILEPVRVGLFWISALCGAVLLFGFLAGMTALFRKEHRRTGAVMAGLTILIVPVVFIAGIVARALG